MNLHSHNTYSGSEFNEYFKNYILETGEKVKAPFGFGEFSINKKKRKKIKKKFPSKFH